MISLALMLRQMSLSIVAPFIATYCTQLTGYTPMLAGMVLGIFGLMQAILQTPFGMLSDKFGTKRILLIGLTITVAGLLLAYVATSIYTLIISRMLQGCGAIIGVGYSWIAGMAPDDKRAKTMGILSFMVSFGAMLSFILGPLLRNYLAVNQIFLCCAIFIIMTELYILFFTPSSGKPRETTGRINGVALRQFLADRPFMRLCSAAFINNFMLTSILFIVPMHLQGLLKETQLWIVFIPALAVAILMIRLTVQAVNKGFSYRMMGFSFLLDTIGILCIMKVSLLSTMLGLALFAGGYASNVTIISSKVNELTPNASRGTANGLFNAIQYLGNFIGPVLIGMLWDVSSIATDIPLLCLGMIGIIMAHEEEKNHGNKRSYT
jgi:MFS family permease